MIDMGRLLFLDSGTLTPMLKKMEKAGYVTLENDEALQMYALLHKLMKSF